MRNISHEMECEKKSREYATHKVGETKKLEQKQPNTHLQQQ